jgi:hypothetical protein
MRFGRGRIQSGRRVGATASLGEYRLTTSRRCSAYTTPAIARVDYGVELGKLRAIQRVRNDESDTKSEITRILREIEVLQERLARLLRAW